MGKNERVIHLPGETITERQALRWYKREKDWYVLRFWERRWPWAKACFFLRCPDCRHLFQDHEYGFTSELDPRFSESKKTCPRCGTVWPYSTFGRWLRYIATEMAEEREAGKAKSSSTDRSP
jgi:uncharacterized C2H2 Zn-finger protein